MDVGRVVALGLGETAPWKLVGQHLDTTGRPNKLFLELAVDRGAIFPCPICGKLCKAHDFDAFSWRHLDFFDYHCFVTARVPRMLGPVHGIKRVGVPWARQGSRFTLLFEQAALALVREMSVLAAARIIGITNNRLWRIVENYVSRAVERLDPGAVRTVGVDRNAFQRNGSTVAVFLDLDRKERPVLFAAPAIDTDVTAAFEGFIGQRDAPSPRIVDVTTEAAGSASSLSEVYLAARDRARSHRSADAFTAMIYLLAAPLGDI